MITALIIIAFFIIFGAVVRWAETPTKDFTPLNFPTHPFKLDSLEDLIMPKLSDRPHGSNTPK